VYAALRSAAFPIDDAIQNHNIITDGE
jgi:hypothetical protein